MEEKRGGKKVWRGEGGRRIYCINEVREEEIPPCRAMGGIHTWVRCEPTFRGGECEHREVCVGCGVEKIWTSGD